ncbi:MAG: hypothetical protein NC310_08325 [Roseburia sp.]|nr:hypothetical protein [Anaeroplasma bactoclasticum]MCM1197055.1 hypothetical protein [Roseburia sp.]MCM1557703.1 hypothetical protein [Anaeroplasma bactoclasticum]
MPIVLILKRAKKSYNKSFSRYYSLVNCKTNGIMGYAYRNAFSLINDLPSEENKGSIFYLCNILSKMFVNSDKTLVAYYNTIFDENVLEIINYIICDLDGYSYYLYQWYKEEVANKSDSELEIEMNIPMEAKDY